MDCYKPSYLANISKELSNINKNLQSINQTLNRIEETSRFKAGPITFNVATPKFKEGTELKNS